jgi:hypothetical protein
MDDGRRAGILEMAKKAAIRAFVISYFRFANCRIANESVAGSRRRRRVRSLFRRVVPDISCRTEPSQRQRERVRSEPGRSSSRSLFANRGGRGSIPAKFGVLFQNAPRLCVEAQSFSAGLM